MKETTVAKEINWAKKIREFHHHNTPGWLEKVKIEKYEYYAERRKTEVAAISSILAVMQLPLTHPLYLIKTRMQAEPASSLTHIKDIIKSGGKLALWRGIFPSSARIAAKESFNGILMIYGKNSVEERLSTSLKSKYPQAANILSGIIIGSINTFLTNPLDALATQLMTDKNNANVMQICKETGKKLFSRGLEANLYKSWLSTGAFFACDDKIKQFSNKILDKQYENLIPIISGIITGGMVTIITNPFDVVKTLQQKKDNPFKGNVYKSIKEIVKTNGVKHLYAGLSYRSILIGFAAIGNSTVRSWAEYIENQQPNNSKER